MLRLILAIFFCWGLCSAAGPVYVVLWFDTEDYVEPSADDAALRLATDLEELGVRATFKVVGEKARTLEARARRDVIRALSRHNIGYHADSHSFPPTPAVYLRELGLLEGASEFERREGPGVEDLRRIFGITPSCYGQPGSSWGPQSNPALRHMGIPVYLDEGSQVGLNDQPFWYGGMLYAFHMGRYLIRPSIEEPDKFEDTMRQFREAASALSRQGGGLISTYYHPTEFVTTEFWDGVNFRHGVYTERSEWKRPGLRTRDHADLAFSILRRYVKEALAVPGVRFVTARDLLQLYASPQPASLDRAVAAAHLAKHITWLQDEGGVWSASELLQILLGMDPRYVDGPASRKLTTLAASSVPRAVFDRATADVVGFVSRHHRLPASVWMGSDQLSLADFTATLAAANGSSTAVEIKHGELAFETHFATDPAKAFNWVIHPEGFSAPELLELGKLQGWTLKPARLR